MRWYTRLAYGVAAVVVVKSAIVCDLNYNVTLYLNRRLTRIVRGRILAVISVARWLGTPIRYGITNPSSVRPS